MRVEDIKDIAALSKEDRMKYDEAIKVYRDNLVTEAYARNEGRAKGYAKGFAEGFAEGYAEGRAEEKLDNARNAKRLGLSPDVISLALGLSIDELDAL